MAKSILVRKELIDETLASAPKQGKKLLEPLKSFAKEAGLPFKILEDMEVSNDAEVHKKEGDLWFCIEGEVTFIYGGKLVDPKTKIKSDGTLDKQELVAKEIRGGSGATLKAGDWLWIPAGEPHQHKSSGVARLFIIKIPATSRDH